MRIVEIERILVRSSWIGEKFFEKIPILFCFFGILYI